MGGSILNIYVSIQTLVSVLINTCVMRSILKFEFLSLRQYITPVTPCGCACANTAPLTHFTHAHPPPSVCVAGCRLVFFTAAEQNIASCDVCRKQMMYCTVATPQMYTHFYKHTRKRTQSCKVNGGRGRGIP